MKLGVHAYAWCSEWSNNSLDAIDKAKALGLDFIEIPLMNLELFDAEAIRSKLQATGLEAVTSTLLLDESMDITSESEEIRQNGINYLKACVRAAKSIHADLFTGVIYSLFSKKSAQRPEEQIWHYSADALREVAVYAQDLGVQIGLEPINRYETYLINTCEQALRLKEMIGQPNVKIHLDTYHMNIEEKSFYEATKLAGQELIHFHFNENDWGIPGTGNVQWDEIFKALSENQYQGYASIESVVDFHGNHVWRQLAPDGDTLAREGIKFIKKMKQKHGL